VSVPIKNNEMYIKINYGKIIILACRLFLLASFKYTVMIFFFGCAAFSPSTHQDLAEAFHDNPADHIKIMAIKTVNL